MSYRDCCRQYYRAQMLGHGLPMYSPQLGHGIFSSIFKTVVPFLKSTVAPRLIRGAASVANDLIRGDSLAGSAKRHGSKFLKSTLTDVLGRQSSRPPPTKVRKKRKRRAIHKNRSGNDAF